MSRPASRLLSLLAAGVLSFAGWTSAHADAIPNDPIRTTYMNSMNGKKIVFVVMSMGMDIDQGWMAAMTPQAKELGYTIEVRDANWKPDAGVQALSSAIAEKPDLIMVQNFDFQTYARQLARAQKQGIPVIQVNLQSSTVTDAFVGVSWYDIGVKQARAIVSACGEGSGKTGKIALVEGLPTSPASLLAQAGVESVLKDHPGIEVVSKQSADWDATKARAVTATVLKQHADLCGIIGFWDIMDLGTAAAVSAAGKTKDIVLVTSGAGETKAACDKIADGTFTNYVTYDIPGQGRDLNDAIREIFQSKEDAGSHPYALYAQLKEITKANMRPSSCWSLQSLKEGFW